MSHWDWNQNESRHGRQRFERGDLKYVILGLLEEHPSYGYEIMRALEDRFHGFYAPSPGTVYPTLQWLQDLGYVTVVDQDGRKVYTITDEGRRFLAARGPRVDEVRERMRSWSMPFDSKEFHDEMRDFTQELRDMAKDLRHEARWANPDKLRRVRDVVMQAGRQIEEILREADVRAGEAKAAGTAGPASGPGPAGTDRPGSAPKPPETGEGPSTWSEVDPSHGDTATQV